MVHAKTKRTWFVVGVIAFCTLVLYLLTVRMIGQQGVTTYAQVTPSPLPTDTITPIHGPIEITENEIRAIPTLGSTKTIENGSVMIYIPAGDFLMGSSDADKLADDDEEPQHSVYLDAFWIGKFEVTNALYQKCVDAGPCSTPSDHRRDTKANRPVANVSWKDANVYLQWLNEKTGKAYRLPTEAEWEKAACWDQVKQEKRIYPWGNQFDRNLLSSLGVAVANACSTQDGSGTGSHGCHVPRYPANPLPVANSAGGASPYGTMDMVGNVSEWVTDWYGMQYYGKSPKNNPQGADSGFGHSLRGGWGAGMTGIYARCSARSLDYPLSRDHFIGFRLAESATP